MGELKNYPMPSAAGLTGEASRWPWSFDLMVRVMISRMGPMG